MTTTCPRLTIFDLDHTLLDGDTDTLWFQFLLEQGLLPAQMAIDNEQLQAQYRTGAVSAQTFSSFYASTLAAFPPAQLEELRATFTAKAIIPRIKSKAIALLVKHRQQGDILLLSSATSRFLTTLTARHLGFTHILGTELETDSDGRFTGRTSGTLNMREGKVIRLQHWLQSQSWGRPATWEHATFYSDSMNDLPLLQAVGNPVAVDPDPILEQTATAHQWPILYLSQTH